LTQLEQARKGVITQAMAEAADAEGVSGEEIRAGIEAGQIVLPCNRNHEGFRPVAVGKGLSTKVNANIGTSEINPDIAGELEKMKAAVAGGAHSVMDLSTGGDIDRCRKEIIAASEVMVGTVPVYQVMVGAARSGKSMAEMTEDDIFSAIIKHCEDGADFITVHCGVTRSVIEELKSRRRVMGMVSRGGAFMMAWMLHNERENGNRQETRCDAKPGGRIAARLR